MPQQRAMTEGTDSHRTTELPCSNPTTTTGYAGIGTANDVQAQKNGNFMVRVLSKEALESTTCLSSVKGECFHAYLPSPLHTDIPPLPLFLSHQSRRTTTKQCVHQPESKTK